MRKEWGKRPLPLAASSVMLAVRWQPMSMMVLIASYSTW